jgi:hypothetical protein
LLSLVDADCSLNGRRSRAPGACTASVSSMLPFSPPTQTSCSPQDTSSTVETSSAWPCLPMGPHRCRLQAASFSPPPRASGNERGHGCGSRSSLGIWSRLLMPGRSTMKLAAHRPPVLRRTGTGHRWKSVRVLVVHDGVEEEVWCCL